MKNILVPIKNIPEEKTTIDKAVELAEKFDSIITLMTVDNSKKLLRNISDSGLIKDGRMLSHASNYGLEGKDIISKEDNKEEVKEKFNLYDAFNATNFLKDVEQMYQSKGIKTNIITAEGDPASAILDESEKGDYDLIIMKTHTMKERKRFMLGSVTDKVVHHINIPILIIR